MARLTFLGTGTSTGIPEIGCQCDTCLSNDPRDHRLRASALIEINGFNLLIDAGPDFRQQLLVHHIDRLDAIFLTHEHYDHVGGLDDIRPLYRQGEPCHVYAEPNVITALTTRMPYAFGEHRYPGVPSIQLLPIIAGETISLSSQVEILPIRVMHGKLPIVGFRIGDLAYITDCKTLPEESYKALEGVKVLVLNALRHYVHPSHLSLSEALQVTSRIEAESTYLIHFAHTFGRHVEIETHLPNSVYAAYDGLTIPF